MCPGERRHAYLHPSSSSFPLVNSWLAGQASRHGKACRFGCGVLSPAPIPGRPWPLAGRGRQGAGRAWTTRAALKKRASLFRQDMDMHACVHVCGQMLHVRWIGSVDHACSSSVYVCIHHKINGPGRKGKLIFQK